MSFAEMQIEFIKDENHRYIGFTEGLQISNIYDQAI